MEPCLIHALFLGRIIIQRMVFSARPFTAHLLYRLPGRSDGHIILKALLVSRFPRCSVRLEAGGAGGKRGRAEGGYRKAGEWRRRSHIRRVA